jgi:hypothetical protein
MLNSEELLGATQYLTLISEVSYKPMSPYVAITGFDCTTHVLKADALHPVVVCGGSSFLD